MSDFTQSAVETTRLMQALAAAVGRHRYLPNYKKVQRAFAAGVVETRKNGLRRFMRPDDNPILAAHFDLPWIPGVAARLDHRAAEAASESAVAA